jgi:hypothetical protein
MKENEKKLTVTHRKLEKQLLIVVTICSLTDFELKWRIKFAVWQQIIWSEITDTAFKLAVFNGARICEGDEMIADVTVKYSYSKILGTYIISGYEIYNVREVKSKFRKVQ